MDYKKITLIFVLVIFIISLWTRTHLVHNKFIIIGEKTMYIVTKKKLIQVDDINNYNFYKSNIIYNDGILKDISFYYDNKTKQFQYFDKENKKIDYIYDKKYTNSNSSIGIITNSDKYSIKKADKKELSPTELNYFEYILNKNSLNVDVEDIDIYKSENYYMAKLDNDLSEEYNRVFSIVFKVEKGNPVEIAKKITDFNNGYNVFLPYLYAAANLNNNRGYDAIVLYSKFGEPPKDRFCLYNVNKKLKAISISDNCEVPHD